MDSKCSSCHSAVVVAPKKTCQSCLKRKKSKQIQNLQGDTKSCSKVNSSRSNNSAVQKSTRIAETKLESHQSNTEIRRKKRVERDGTVVVQESKKQLSQVQTVIERIQDEIRVSRIRSMDTILMDGQLLLYLDQLKRNAYKYSVEVLHRPFHELIQLLQDATAIDYEGVMEDWKERVEGPYQRQPIESDDDVKNIGIENDDEVKNIGHHQQHKMARVSVGFNTERAFERCKFREEWEIVMDMTPEEYTGRKIGQVLGDRLLFDENKSDENQLFISPYLCGRRDLYYDERLHYYQRTGKPCQNEWDPVSIVFYTCMVIYFDPSQNIKGEWKFLKDIEIEARILNKKTKFLTPPPQLPQQYASLVQDVKPNNPLPSAFFSSSSSSSYSAPPFSSSNEASSSSQAASDQSAPQASNALVAVDFTPRNNTSQLGQNNVPSEVAVRVQQVVPYLQPAYQSFLQSQWNLPINKMDYGKEYAYAMTLNEGSDELLARIESAGHTYEVVNNIKGQLEALDHFLQDGKNGHELKATVNLETMTKLRNWYNSHCNVIPPSLDDDDIPIFKLSDPIKSPPPLFRKFSF